MFSLSKTSFKKSMVRGLGRCVIWLDQTPDKETYRDLVLWGCLHNLSYDTQCEGTRSYYMYLLQSKYQDNFFEPKIIEEFLKFTYDSWKFEHLANLLYCFAVDGSQAAKDAFYKKLDLLLELVRKSKRKNSSLVNELRAQLEWLGIWMVMGIKMKGFQYFVFHIGELFLERKNTAQWFDFLWFYEQSEYYLQKKRVHSFFEKHSRNSQKCISQTSYSYGPKEINAFYEQIKQSQKEAEKRKTSFKSAAHPILLEELISSYHSENKFFNRFALIRFGKNATLEELEKLANYIIKEPDKEKKANLLFVFRNRTFPLDETILIDYSKDENENLSEIAFELLGQISSELVYQYVHNLIVHKEKVIQALPAFCRNYKKEDEVLLMKTLKSILVTYSGNWHSVYSSILSIAERNKVIPNTALFYMYEHILCSFCREYIVRELVKRNAFPNEYLEECLYDSREDIRRFAKRKLKQHNT